MKAHPKIVDALQEIDAALLNGDTFDNPENRVELRSYLARWMRSITDPEEYRSACTYTLGPGLHCATRFDHAAGTFEIHVFDGALVGHGNTPREAAGHLADQLRAIGIYVEQREGMRR